MKFFFSLLAMMMSMVSTTDAAELGGLPAEGPAVDEHRLTAEERALGGPKPIYGQDNRRDWGRIADPRVRSAARASVALIADRVVTTKPGLLETVASPLWQSHLLCKDENFSSQISVAFCSGVLIAQDIVATAGHCVQEVAHNPRSLPLSAIRFVFGFTAENHEDPGRSQFDEQQIYRGAAVLGGRIQSTSQGTEDWAAIRLDRPVPSEIARPVLLNTKGVEAGARIYVIGYPSGIPLKYAPGAEVRDASGESSFVSNLDAFQGNSGSGVFLSSSNELVGLLVKGDTDYYYDSAKRCRYAYRCRQTGCTGEEVTRIEKVRLP